MVRPSSRSDIKSVREKLFAVLIDSGVSANDALKVLSQCQAHIRNTIMVETIAKECGLKVSGFRANEHLELYYDLKRGRHEMGYISKGWDDPGFRIGDLVKIPKQKLAVFKSSVLKILKFCTTNGIGMTVEQEKDTIEIQMDGVIYSEGFNKTTFMKTLETLNECVEKAEDMMGC